MTAEPAAAGWTDAMLAAALVCVDPIGLGGVVVRSGPGPARDGWIATMLALLPDDAPVRRIPLRIDDDRLLGGLDLSASLAAGRPVLETGVLTACDGGVAILAMAERMEAGAAARLTAVLDSGEVVIERDGLTTRLGTHVGLIVLDEGLSPEERPPDALLERLALRIDLNALSGLRRPESPYGAAAVAKARRALAAVSPAPDAAIEALCRMGEMFGVGSMRAPLLALRAARAMAALEGRTGIGAEDVAAAARLVLVPRMLTPPADAAEQTGEEPPDPPPADDPPKDDPQEDDGETDADDRGIDAEMLIAAVQAALPDDLLDQVKAAGRRPARSVAGQGSGASVKSSRRGRPTGSRRGALRSGDRLNLPETLRAATPWQKLRAQGSTSALIQVRQEDFRIRRFVQRQEATTIFLVDASGSAAVQRLSEAKGAVEMLLAKAYVSRARVALIAFRNTGAELLLAPTRSLTRAKRSLADLPAGGGTPLAAGLDASLTLARAEMARDRTPLIVILTDGRANIARDGSPGRAAAESDAMAAARGFREASIGAVFIDTAPRAQPGGDRFAAAMGAVYAPLPYVNAEAVSGLVDRLRTAQR